MSENEQKEVNAAEALRKAAQEAADKAAQEEQCCCGDKQCSCGEQCEDAAKPEVTDPAAVEALAAAEAKATEAMDMYVRAMAEMENVRRRCAEDVQKAQKFGIEKFAQNLLPVADSLEKAMESVKDAEDSVREGIQVTHKQLMHALEVSGMTVIDPDGEKFDPVTSQAIAMVPASEGKTTGMVAQVFQKGWKIHDRVIRPAMVSVVQ